MKKLKKDSFEKTDTETDSALAWALKFNKTNPIKYNGMWFPIGTLKKLLEAFED